MAECEIGLTRWPQIPELHAIDKNVKSMSVEMGWSTGASWSKDELLQNNGEVVEEPGNGCILC